jgi:peptidylprolyl isomerase
MTRALRALPPRIARFAAAVAVASSAALSGCSDDPLGPTVPEDVEFAASLGIDLASMTRLPSGVYIETLVPGAGDPVTEGTMLLRYTLWLPDGTQIDDNREPGDPIFPVNLANPGTVAGFAIGIVGMRVGEERRIIVPSALGYGPRETGGIPPQSVLVFQVGLEGVEGAAAP